MFNAIVPVFKRTPRDWGSTRSANEIVRGYLDAFEPDFVVAADGIDVTAFDVPATHAVSLDTMMTRDGLAQRGMDVMPVYRWRYEREFRFVQREPILLRSPATGTGPHSLFLAAVFGEYPSASGPLKVFAEGFRDMGGKEAKLSPSAYVKILKGALCPLRLGSSGFEERGASGPRRAFVLIDPQNAGDIIDFWNLRALGWHIVAIPADWAARIAPEVARTIARQHQPDQVLPASYTRALFMKGRSVSDEQLLAFVRKVAAREDACVVQPWQPRIWEPELREADRAPRIGLSAKEEEQEVEVRDETISFETIGPDFMDRTWSVERARIANVIELRSFDLSTLASLIPAQIPDLDELLRWVGPANMIRNSSDGVAVLTDRAGQPMTWRLPHGLRVFEKLFAPRGDLRLSGAGKIAGRMIDLVGGPDRARVVTNVELVRLLGRASETASRDVPHDDLFGLFNKLHQNRPDMAEKRIEAMVRQKVVKLGMRLQCDHCAQQNWFALDELRESASCHWCLDELRFPTAMPPRRPRWTYRPLGPFGVKDHAQGAYVVAAAIKTLRELGGFPRTTWIPSFTLTSAAGELEADFGLLWEGDGLRQRVRPQLLLGECKTFRAFAAADINRMKQLAKTFPKAVMVLATFNSELTSSQQKLIAPFAEWGRKNWRTPVLVLTARELTSDFGVPYCWRHAGVAREQRIYEAITAAPAPRTSLRRLADATQQLHLGMPADANWPHYDAP